MDTNSQANTTGQDVFVMPPSGHLYAYPGMMNGLVRDSFVEDTQEDCKRLVATSTVHWEWFYGWQQAFDTYFPDASKINQFNFSLPVVPVISFFI